MHKFEAVQHIDLRNISDYTLREAFNDLCETISHMARQQEEHVLKTVNEAVEKVGNVVEAKGQPLTPELFFEVIRKVRLDFDPDGKALFPTFFAGKEGIVAFEKLMTKLESEPYRTQFNDLMEAKKEEWRVRQSNRKLVD